jgi:hypothetical protein
MTKTERYFIGVDASNIEYVVPVGKHDEFFEWANLGCGDPRYSQIPDYRGARQQDADVLGFQVRDNQGAILMADYSIVEALKVQQWERAKRSWRFRATTVPGETPHPPRCSALVVTPLASLRVICTSQ